jgi:hypothetical protein
MIQRARGEGGREGLEGMFAEAGALDPKLRP